MARIDGDDDGNYIVGGPDDDSIYGHGGADILLGRVGNDFIEGGVGADLLLGGDGIDTIDYNGDAGVYVSLGPGDDFGYGAGGDADGDTIYGVENVQGTGSYDDYLVGSPVDNVLSGYGGNDSLVGSGGNDTLNGGAGADFLEGGAGADTMNGGSGIDTVNYAYSSVGIFVGLDGFTCVGGDSAGDRLFGIENVWGTYGEDTLIGNDTANVFSGNGSADYLFGYGGADTLRGDYGNDYLFGGAGADVLIGGDGVDTASYYDSGAEVFVLVASSYEGEATGIGEGYSGDAEGDRLYEIENLEGSRFGDALIGSAYDNVLSGLAGNDTLYGEAGNDTLDGGNGDDLLQGGAGADMLVGGNGVDTVDYGGNVGVSVDLGLGFAVLGDAEGDRFVGIENVTGTFLRDILTGSAVDNALWGQGGDDVLTGLGGKDTLTGGAGADRFVYGSFAESEVGANADRITDFSRVQGDRIDLSAIDASTVVAGNQAFTFIGSGVFTHHAGELRFAVISPGVTAIAGDVNGDGASDFHIQLTGTIALVAADFAL